MADDGEGGLTARGFSLLKISFGLSHLAGHMGKADDLILPGLGSRVSVESSGPHLHCQNAICPALCDQCLRPREGRIGRSSSSRLYAGEPVRDPSVR